MKLFTTLLTSFLLFTAVLSGQAGMTVEFSSDCIMPGTTYSMTYMGTDATGRHFYGDESINGAGQPVVQIFWDQPSGSWHIGIPGIGSSGIIHATAPNTFSPNPPDSATELYPAGTGGCPGINATVSGTGTQSTAGIPCEGIGDDDMDGVCNDVDVCPGEDDTIDADGDNIPDCNDPNPGVFDGVSFDSPCIGEILPFTLTGSDGTRNIYTNAPQNLEIAFSTANDRWEMRGAGAGGAVSHFNTLATLPDPPSSIAMAWEADPAGGCTDVPTVSGTGTQDSRCINIVADCPDDGDACTEAALDEDCNCTNVPITNVLPTATCNPTVTVELNMDGVAILAAADVDNGSTDDACGSISTLALDRTGFDCDVVNNTLTVTLTVTDNEGGMATCTADVTVEDNIAPTFTCTDITVDLDANGEYFITNSDVLTRMVQDWDDNCAPAPTNFGSGLRLITCANSTSGTFSYFFGAFDGNGQEMTCTSTITVNDPTLACDDDPVARCAATAIVQIDADGNADAGSIDDGSTDDNTPAGDLIFSIDGDVLDCADVDMPAQMVTLVVTDNVGQTSTCTSEVTVEDNIAPAITCQNIAIDLDANGTARLNTLAVVNEVLTSFNDNCAADWVSLGFTVGSIGCAQIGVIDLTIFFRDRPQIPSAQQTRCTVQVQVNDPLGVCGTDPVVSCQDFGAAPDPDGTYTLDANSMDNGSSDDGSVYTLAFCNQTSSVGNATDDQHFRNVGHGQSFVAAQTGAIQKIRVRFFGEESGVNLHFYDGGQGSGINGRVGTPVYTEANIELFASVDGASTEILLSTPLPVVQGQAYTFIFEGFTDVYYDGSIGGGPYTDGDAFFNYASGFPPDLRFEVDFIGPTTQVFSGDADYPVTVFAIDDQGNASPGCNAIFTLDQALPVEWLFFSADAGAKSVDLQWETTTEPDNAGFHLERSATGTEWSVIGQVPARSGADQRYEYTDATPLEGNGYYRIRQTDFDGQLTYSPVETVTFYGDAPLVISPNPATNEVQVLLPEGAELVGLLDVTGRAVLIRFTGNRNRLSADVSGLTAGIYVVRVRLASGAERVRRLQIR